jgi:hypothetical protein
MLSKMLEMEFTDLNGTFDFLSLSAFQMAVYLEISGNFIKAS